MHNQNNSASLKFYNREPCSTIDPYKNGENAFIYSKQPQQQKQDAALKHYVCMSSDSLRMQTLADRAPMTDAIRFRTVLLQTNRPAFSPLLDFPFMAETMSNHLQQLQ
jgi:hypothetical protein